MDREVVAAGPNGTAGRSALYRRILRWHFLAGLVCVPFILLLAATGALYLFHRETDDAVYASVMLRTQPRGPAAHALPPAELIARAVQAFPGQVQALVVPADKGHNAQVDITRSGGDALQVFVDPETGGVAGAIDESERIMTRVKHIHSLTVAGTVGRAVVEIVAGWIIVLTATGVYLWWPRGRTTGVVSIRPHAAGRVWWRDLHAVTGAFGGSVILFLALTGMPWSVFWGQHVNAWFTAQGLGIPMGMWSGIPKSAVPASALGDLPWAQQHDAIPASTDPHAQHAGTRAGAPTKLQPASASATTADPLSPDAVVRQLAAIGMESDYRLVLPGNSTGVYSAIRSAGERKRQRVIHLDQNSGKVLMDLGPDAIGPIGRITEWGVSVHQGSEYGAANMAIMLAGGLSLITLCVSGIVAWCKRRPTGRLAAPARREADRLAVGVIGIAVLLGCAFPLLGASVLAVILVDYVMSHARLADL